MFVGKYGVPAALAVVVITVAVWGLMAKDTRSSTSVGTNPLVDPWTGPYGGVPPWDQMRPELFAEAFTIALAEERAEIDAIASRTGPPTFGNAVEAFDHSGRMRMRVRRLFVREAPPRSKIEAASRLPVCW